LDVPGTYIKLILKNDDTAIIIFFDLTFFLGPQTRDPGY
jgi:hypothetical protein